MDGADRQGVRDRDNAEGNGALTPHLLMFMTPACMPPLLPARTPNTFTVVLAVFRLCSGRGELLPLDHFVVLDPSMNALGGGRVEDDRAGG